MRVQRLATVVREDGALPSSPVRYVVHLDGRRHSSHETVRDALTSLSHLGRTAIRRTGARSGPLFVATIYPRPVAQVAGYTDTHVLSLPKLGDHRYGEQVPTPSDDDLRGKVTKLGGRYDHEVRRSGIAVAKLRYSVRPDTGLVAVHGLAVHPDHQGAGLAHRLMDKLQDNAEEHGRQIYHGDRTEDGYRWWQHYSQRPSFKPRLHAPSPGDAGPDKSLRPKDTYDLLFDPYEHDRAKRASRGWTHYYANVPPGWEQ